MVPKAALYILIIFCCFSKTSVSQEQKFIEVSISDTTSLKPILFVYQIDIGSDKNNYLDMDSPNENSEAPSLATTLSLTELDAVLKREKFDFESASEKNYTLSEYKNNNPSYTVKLRSEDELKKLYSAVKSIKGITGKIKEIEYESYSMYETNSFKRIYTKAKAKANLIAVSSMVQLGDVLAVTELKESTDPLFSYKNLLKGMPYNGYGEEELSDHKYVKNYTYKFSIK